MAISPQIIQRAHGDPSSCCHEWLSEVRSEPEALLCVRFELPQHWLQDSPEKPLWALYLWREGVLSIAVAEVEPTNEKSHPGELFDCWVERHRLFTARSGEALPLGTREVGKPWGREVWFTGVERRAVCSFVDGSAEVPQPWLLAALPGADYARAGKPTLLLKILDPSPERVTGDLYFELHRDKEEVYVVTQVDPAAWEGGVGYLRYGFDPVYITRHGDEQQFRHAYLEAVEAYRDVRQTIDALPSGDPVPDRLQSRERELRAAMDAFTWLKPVSRGDVVHVPRRLPHALQHGVQVIELQTPVYERKILSFAQQVLTQSHWDTAEAVAEMKLLPPREAPRPMLRDVDGASERLIAEAADFELRRLRIAPGARLPLAITGPYALMIIEAGVIELSGRGYKAKQAAWLPGGWQGVLTLAQAAPPVDLLLALPRS
jgi:hypothetical protein